MEKNKRVGLWLILGTIVIFITMIQSNSPDAFGHCWYGCGVDWILAMSGIVSIILGVVYLIAGGESK